MGVPIVKVWNLDKSDKGSSAPQLARSSKIQYNTKIFPVSNEIDLENIVSMFVTVFF
jgi:hypothetical protein